MSSARFQLTTKTWASPWLECQTECAATAHKLFDGSARGLAGQCGIVHVRTNVKDAIFVERGLVNLAVSDTGIERTAVVGDEATVFFGSHFLHPFFLTWRWS